MSVFRLLVLNLGQGADNTDRTQ